MFDSYNGLYNGFEEKLYYKNGINEHIELCYSEKNKNNKIWILVKSTGRIGCLEIGSYGNYSFDFNECGFDYNRTPLNDNQSFITAMKFIKNNINMNIVIMEKIQNTIEDHKTYNTIKYIYNALNKNTNKKFKNASTKDLTTSINKFFSVYASQVLRKDNNDKYWVTDCPPLVTCFMMSPT